MELMSGAQALEILADLPATRVAGGITLLVCATLAVYGLVRGARSLAHRVTAGRTAPADMRTLTIKQLRTSSDYREATPEERMAIGMLHPTVELVRENDFARHATAVAREIVGEENCATWPYRHINLEEAAEDLRQSYGSIKVGPATYYHGSN